jgi:large subunit ribosomal protein L5
MPRLKQKYLKEVKGELQKKFNYENPMRIPSLTKVVINMGIAEASKDKNTIQACVNELTALSGQKPVLTKAKKAISNFKLREGQPIGVKVTLRGKRMFDFLDRFCNIVAPRVPNYTLGLQDQQIFPEVNLDEVKRTQGMHISFVTTAETDDECIELLRLLGLPFKNLPVSVPA